MPKEGFVNAAAPFAYLPVQAIPFGAGSITVWVIEIVITLALSAVFAFAFCSSVTIQESSMDPTFQAGNKVLINRTSYVIGRVKRGDLIAYSNSERTDASVHVKRVVGLPGETIQIRDGLILINGQTYIEDREVAAITFGGLAEEGELDVALFLCRRRK